MKIKKKNLWSQFTPILAIDYCIPIQKKDPEISKLNKLPKYKSVIMIMTLMISIIRTTTTTAKHHLKDHKVLPSCYNQSITWLNASTKTVHLFLKKVLKHNIF